MAQDCVVDDARPNRATAPQNWSAQRFAGTTSSGAQLAFEMHRAWRSQAFKGDDREPVRREVKVGKTKDKEVEILSGLKVGDKIVKEDKKKDEEEQE